MEVPIYLKISSFIEEEILSGDYQANDRVPSTNEFAKSMQINPATALKGLNHLVDKGILYKKRGLGMFVSEKAEDIVKAEHREHFLEESLPRFIQEGKRLGFSLEELIQLIEEK